MTGTQEGGKDGGEIAGLSTAETAGMGAWGAGGACGMRGGAGR